MVLPFTPHGNASHPCAGLEAREALRPPVSQAYFDANLGLFCFYVCWAGIAVVGMYKARAHPRFAKVRPLSVTLTSMFAAVLFLSGGTIAAALQLPCIYSMAAHVLGVAIIGVVLILRTLIICFEAQFAKVVVSAAARTSGLSDVEGGGGTETDSKRSTTLSSMENIANTLQATKLLMSIVGGARQVSSLTLPELVDARAGYELFGVIYFMPGALVVLILILAVPPTYQCSSSLCTEIFLEVEIAVCCMLSYVIVLNGRLLLIAYRMVGFDDKGLIVELGSIVLVIAPIVLLTMILAIADPHDWAFDRVFNWQSINFITCMGFAWVSYGHQLVMVMRANYLAKIEDQLAERVELISKMMPILEKNAELRRDFEQFAAKHYVAESVAFLASVTEYKRYFLDKGDNWRTSKLHLLVKTYIQVGSSLEVNISAVARERILQRAKQKMDVDAIDVFNEAFEQVKEMVQNGAWRDFVRHNHARMLQQHTGTTAMSPLVSMLMMGPATVSSSPAKKQTALSPATSTHATTTTTDGGGPRSTSSLS